MRLEFLISVLLLTSIVLLVNGEDKDSKDEDADIEDDCEWTRCKFVDSGQPKCSNGCQMTEIDRGCHYDDFAKYKCCC
ncbi:hypothetical protein Ocin01_04541 [Orchesella cincta]|uniref:Uncharacterized protein n=1 Tax=Orchesella cincta TaxID=48709 RepID=A0A1D2NA78_ORCCI|nr:hypothetical protein Ocin01_04541 [Orchesella cincta]